MPHRMRRGQQDANAAWVKFTAAQAAQKSAGHWHCPLRRFTAAQAAQKTADHERGCRLRFTSAKCLGAWIRSRRPSPKFCTTKRSARQSRQPRAASASRSDEKSAERAPQHHGVLPAHRLSCSGAPSSKLSAPPEPARHPNRQWNARQQAPADCQTCWAQF